ncbi:MAG: type II toxin-antitoxin system PemK/MazF family toxin [Deltaproteobacteria bacterium]|nr:type II toxin-antitoxin system PemK/MazF family toxin [Deltaproteobacteria bacterium]
MNRGSIYWVNLDPTQGPEIRKIRPCVLVGATPVNKARRTVVVIPLSSGGKPRPPLAIAVFALGKSSIAVCDQIRTVDKSRLVKEAGELSDEDMKRIEDGLKKILMLP